MLVYGKVPSVEFVGFVAAGSVYLVSLFFYRVETFINSFPDKDFTFPEIS